MVGNAEPAVAGADDRQQNEAHLRSNFPPGQDYFPLCLLGTECSFEETCDGYCVDDESLPLQAADY